MVIQQKILPRVDVFKTFYGRSFYDAALGKCLDDLIP